MGVDIKLTDRELPISPVVLEFLSAYVHGKVPESVWHDQLSEKLVPAEPQRRIAYAESVAKDIMEHPLGRRTIYRVYELLAAIMIGDVRRLRPVQERFRFVCVVGCPRHGGTYLTKALYRAVGLDPARVPNWIAHDGFPDLSPFELDQGHNTYTAMTQQMAEYLAMVEIFFEGRRNENGRIVVPKKATKAVYHGAFFHSMLGPQTEYIITLRHPVAACISTYEKSTGLPPGGKFADRGNIENWAARDSVLLGIDPQSLAATDYFDVYLRYWEHYHYNLALTGLARNRNWRIVAYGRERLMALAGDLQRRFGETTPVEEFKVFEKRDRHPEWNAKAEAAIQRVAAVWQSVGLAFPIPELLEAW